MARPIQNQVTEIIGDYGRGLERTLQGAFPGVLNIYSHHLSAQAPNIRTRPSRHPYSLDVTANIYQILQASPFEASIINPRLQSMGRQGGGPVGDDPDISGIIDVGGTRRGPRTAEGFIGRQIGDAYHLHAWRVATPYLFAHLEREIYTMRLING